METDLRIPVRSLSRGRPASPLCWRAVCLFLSAQKCEDSRVVGLAQWPAFSQQRELSAWWVWALAHGVSVTSVRGLCPLQAGPFCIQARFWEESSSLLLKGAQQGHMGTLHCAKGNPLGPFGLLICILEACCRAFLLSFFPGSRNLPAFF